MNDVESKNVQWITFHTEFAFNALISFFLLPGSTLPY